MRFVKAIGLTESEKILAELCNNSFLHLWTYPNLFSKPAKELCDLLVVFGNDVIIFSDKNCSYGIADDDDLNWKRWYKKSIAHSAAQIENAIRWITDRPDEIYLDARCEHKLPVELPSRANIRFHRVCVAHGASNAAISQYGRPALRIEPGIKDNTKPLTIGRLSHARDWVHVFDENSLTVVLRQLSTTPDFIAYLDARSELLGAGEFVAAESETDLLARYMWHNRTFPSEGRPYAIEPDLWEKVSNDVGFQAGRKEDEVSSFWDRLIERVTRFFVEESLEFGNELSVTEYEIMARILAGETRFSRRVLSKLILDRAYRAKHAAIGSLLPSCQEDINFVLYIGRGAEPAAYAEYRADRASILKLRCIAAKAVLPKKRFVLGIALDAAGSNGGSEDFILVDTQYWDEEAVSKAEKLRQEFGYFVDGKTSVTRFVEDEYPTADTDAVP